MILLLLVITAALLFGAAVIRTILVSIIAIVAAAGILAYVSISTGLSHWMTLAAVAGPIAVGAIVFFRIEEVRARETVRKIQEERRKASRPE